MAQGEGGGQDDTRAARLFEAVVKGVQEEAKAKLIKIFTTTRYIIGASKARAKKELKAIAQKGEDARTTDTRRSPTTSPTTRTTLKQRARG